MGATEVLVLAMSFLRVFLVDFFVGVLPAFFFFGGWSSSTEPAFRFPLEDDGVVSTMLLSANAINEMSATGRTCIEFNIS